MFKYIVAAGIAGLAFAQTPTLPVPPTTQNPPKCIPRHKGPPNQGGPIPPNNATGNTDQPTLRPYPPRTSSDAPQLPPIAPQGANLRPQLPQIAEKPVLSDTVIKTAEQALLTQWKAYLSSKDPKASENHAPPPPAEAWLRYQQTNKLTDSANIPAAFIQKWQSDFSKLPIPERPVGADGKPIPFCDEAENPVPKPN